MQQKASTSSAATRSTDASTYVVPTNQVDAKEPIAILGGPSLGDDRFSGNGRAGSAPAGSGIPVFPADRNAEGNTGVPADQDLCRVINPWGVPKG